MMTITPSGVADFIDDCLDAGEIPCLFGMPGMGKSQSIEQAATRRNAAGMNWPIGLFATEDLVGAPGHENNRTVFRPPVLGIFADDPIDREFIVHLEEINHASIAVQGAIYEMLLNRSINNKPIHPLVRFAASCNPQSARGAANHLSTALRSRMILARFENSSADWLPEAYRLGINSLIIGYITMKAQQGDEAALNGFDPKAEGNSPNPRGWVKANALWETMEKKNREPHARVIALAGAVGEGRAMEFVGFVRLWNARPDLSTAASSPETTPLPDMKEMSAVYASLTWLAFNATRANLANYITYANRLGGEYTTVMMNMATVRDAELKNTKAYIAWSSRIRSRSGDLFLA
jgi:hypothetical protein